MTSYDGPSATPPLPEVTTSSNGRSRFASRSQMDILAENLDGRVLVAIPKKGEASCLLLSTDPRRGLQGTLLLLNFLSAARRA